LRRTLVAALRQSGYFTLVREAETEAETRRLLQLGEVQFVINIPEDFTRRLLRGERPTVLIEADATDPAATGPALAAVRAIADGVLDRDLAGPLARLRPKPGAIDFQIHAHYNPENITQYNVVPGLMGVVLTMTMVVITALAITRERERGTMENLLATPVRPIEVMVGKILPYIAVGYVQVTLILIAAHFIFGVPINGNLGLLYAVALLFIAANLAVGITFSTLAQNQLQAVQIGIFLFSAFDPAHRFHVSFSAACPNGRNGSASACRTPIFCASSAAFCSRATVSPKSRRSFGRWPCSSRWP